MMRLDDITGCAEFAKLAGIGGHKVFHLEGSAFTHTMMVVEQARKFFHDDALMVNVAALHDIGKIYTSIRHGDDDWEYPDHSVCGALRGILCKFVPESDEDFATYQWYIRNHIRPLYWMRKPNYADEIRAIRDKAPNDDCTIERLAGLALCDIRGSVSVEPQTELENFLVGLIASLRA